MNSILGLRIKSFFIDITIVISITLAFYFVLKLLGSEPSDKTMSTIRSWVSQIYFLGCLVLIPAKTLGMKISKVSFKSIDDSFDVGLWGIVKFYFFQVVFLVVGIISIFIILNGQMNSILIGCFIFLLSVSDLAPLLLRKDYAFLHDKFSGVKIIKD